MNFLVDALIEWPRSVARHLEWLGPLFARIVVGWVFLWSGWGKLTHLPLVTENFAGWGIPAPEILAPFASGVEFFGGILLLIGLLTRISAGALGVVMIVAVKVAQWEEVDSAPDTPRSRGDHVSRALPLARHCWRRARFG